jgi:hypothetical protein
MWQAVHVKRLFFTRKIFLYVTSTFDEIELIIPSILVASSRTETAFVLGCRRQLSKWSQDSVKAKMWGNSDDFLSNYLGTQVLITFRSERHNLGLA